MLSILCYEIPHLTEEDNFPSYNLGFIISTLTELNMMTWPHVVRQQEVNFVCLLLLSVHPGPHGRRATTRFHQLLSQLHGQDQTAQEEVQTYQSRVVVIWLSLTVTELCNVLQGDIH